MVTPDLIPMKAEKKNDNSVFGTGVLETEHKIYSFESIGWAEPEDIKSTVKTSKWLKSLTHDHYMFDP